MNGFRSILKRNWRVIAGTVFINVVSSFGMVFAGYSLSFFFDAYEQECNRIKALALTFVVELVIWGAAMALYHISLLVRCKAKKIIKQDLRRMVGNRIGSLHYPDLRAKDSGNLVSWLVNDVEQIYEQTFATLLSGTEALSAALFSLCALFFLSPFIGAAALLLLIVISILPQFAEKYLQKANRERSIAMETALESYKDTVAGASVFFLANLQNQFTKRIADASEQAEISELRFNRTHVSVQVFLSACSLLGQVILIFVSFTAAAAGTAVPGAVLSVANLSGSFFNGISDCVQSVAKAKASRTLWDKFAESVPSPAGRKVIPAVSDISIRDVSFGYPDHPVLQNINWELKAGGKYAVIGESGSGKSTLIQILLGLIPDYSGGVFYNGIEQRTADLCGLYDQAAYVSQEVYLFQDTMRFNITLNQPCSVQRVEEVLAQCRLTDFVKALPQGLDTVIFENGKNLSGGQRQRIALARSLVRNPRWIILDEGTSALDEKNAVEIERMLIEQPNLGVVLITHNLRPAIKEKLDGIYPVKKLPK